MSASPGVGPKFVGGRLESFVRVLEERPVLVRELMLERMSQVSEKMPEGIGKMPEHMPERMSGRMRKRRLSGGGVDGIHQ